MIGYGVDEERGVVSGTAPRKHKKSWGKRLKLSQLPKLLGKDKDGPGNPARLARSYVEAQPVVQQPHPPSRFYYPHLSDFGTVRLPANAYYYPWVNYAPGPLHHAYEEIPASNLVEASCSCSRSTFGKSTRKSRSKHRPTLDPTWCLDDPYSYVRESRLQGAVSDSDFDDEPRYRLDDDVRYATVHPVRPRPGLRSVSAERSGNSKPCRLPNVPQSRNRSLSSFNVSEEIDLIDLSGRKSILECGFNAYDLMTVRGDRDSDSDEINETVLENRPGPTYQLLSDGEKPGGEGNGANGLTWKPKTPSGLEKKHLIVPSLSEIQERHQQMQRKKKQVQFRSNMDIRGDEEESSDSAIIKTNSISNGSEKSEDQESPSAKITIRVPDISQDQDRPQQFPELSRGTTLRRSLSDRSVSGKAMPLFQDTMRLRLRPSSGRKTVVEVFSVESLTDPRSRPKIPPPPPPRRSSSCNKVNVEVNGVIDENRCVVTIPGGEDSDPSANDAKALNNTVLPENPDSHVIDNKLPSKVLSSPPLATCKDISTSFISVEDPKNVQTPTGITRREPTSSSSGICNQSQNAVTCIDVEGFTTRITLDVPFGISAPIRMKRKNRAVKKDSFNESEMDKKEEDEELEVEALYEEIHEHIYEVLSEPDVRCVEDDAGDYVTGKSMFDGASKEDILTYLQERALHLDEDSQSQSPLLNERNSGSRSSGTSDSSSDSRILLPAKKVGNVEIERNDSGVGSETSKPSARIRPRRSSPEEEEEEEYEGDEESLSCEDCRGTLEYQKSFSALICRRCRRRRNERKELILEIVETEIRYGRDLQLLREEFYRPMLVAGLLSPSQLDAMFLNLPELVEWNARFTERLRDSLEIAIEAGDEDLLTVNLGKLFLGASHMLHAFETYCLRQGDASLLLSQLEREKELLRIFLKVSQMENTLLRRMNLRSFLMVPVQRVTKYPLLLGRLYKVTPHQLEGREAIRDAQRKIEAHLEQINTEAKAMGTTKLWRRISIISSNAPARRPVPYSDKAHEMGNIRLRQLALDVLEWSSDGMGFALDGRLEFTQAGDNMWTRRGKHFRLTTIHALLVTLGNPTEHYKPSENGQLLFYSRRTGLQQAALLLARERNSRLTLVREPLILERCLVCQDSEVDGFFEIHDTFSKDTFYFKGNTDDETDLWFQYLQYHSHALGSWRKRRNALANIMIDKRISYQ
ncbi:unnamed protein product [Darwinula stevensoni]|uniref:DH domain-containing protein n=1 Tax=Darwinula stevensoni TaxID=69355 RepID=A0A7R8X560_9CRUS|nr:unnamed protein product [Darwinula stevensoni]CAG0880093.1 unnamed protein product [Darwinula stevensoni]